MESCQNEASEQHTLDEINYWLKVKRDAKSDALKYLEDAAKQVVTITSLLQGVYFAAISFSDIKKVGNIADCWFIIFVSLSLVTVASWMISLYFAMRVFVPETYQADQGKLDLAGQAIQIRDTFDQILAYKQINLRRAIKLLWLSFSPLTANVIVYLIFLPAPPP